LHATLEDGDTQLVLELAHHHGERGLRNVAMACGLAELAGVGYGNDVLELLKGH
jgi:hypothetical protein